jgi:hypothetical protein
MLVKGTSGLRQAARSRWEEEAMVAVTGVEPVT